MLADHCLMRPKLCQLQEINTKTPMDLFYEENPYFKDEYISEEQYISYNDEDHYDYGNNPQGDGENGEELEYEEDFNQEFRYEQDFVETEYCEMLFRLETERSA